MSKTQISTTYIYNCVVMPNAPMNNPEYRKFYQIETVRSPIYLSHSSIHSREMQEYEDFIVSTSSFSVNDFKEMHIWSWFMQTFHTFGILDMILEFYSKLYGLSFIQFYESFYNFCKQHNSIFAREFDVMLQHTKNGCKGGGWSYFDSDLGELFWAIEEGTWLHLVENGNDLKRDILLFLNHLENEHSLHTDPVLLEDLIAFQIFLLTTRDDKREIKIMTFNNSWKEFFISETPLKKEKMTYFFKNPVQESDYVKWGFETIWWGRPQKKFKFGPENLELSQNTEIRI